MGKLKKLRKVGKKVKNSTLLNGDWANETLRVSVFAQKIVRTIAEEMS